MGRWSGQAYADSVYVIAGSHGLVKVGVSADPAVRLATLQTGSAHHLHLAYAAPVNGDAYAAEADAHDLLARYRQVGEWFSVPIDVAVAAVSAAVFRHSRTAGAEPAPEPRWWLRYAVLTAIVAPVWTFSTPTAFIAVACALLGWSAFRLIRYRGPFTIALALHWGGAVVGAIITSMLLAMPFVQARAQDEKTWIRKGATLCESAENLAAAKEGDARGCIAAPMAMPVQVEERRRAATHFKITGLGAGDHEAWADPHSFEAEPSAEEMAPDP